MTPNHLPTNDLRVALPELRRPFTPQAVRYKVQSARRSTPNPGPKDYALVVSYIDARQVIERLNHVVGGEWSDEVACGELPDGLGVATCVLTVLDVERSDVGEATGLAQAKALRSDALKRAAVKFGVGVSVYAAPRILLKPNNGLRPVTIGRDNRPSWGLTEKAERHCRKLYAEWLKKTGIKAFGEPLDHGDLETSQGDWELKAEEMTDEQQQPVVGASNGRSIPPSIETARPGEAVVRADPADDILTEQQYDTLAATIHAVHLEGPALSMLCAAVGVESIDQLTQATLPEFRELLTQEIASRVGSSQ